MKKIISVFILGAGLLVFAGDVLAHSGAGGGSGSGSGGSGAGAGAGAGAGDGGGSGAGSGGNTNPVGNWMSPFIDYPSASVPTGEPVTTVITPSGTAVTVTPAASPYLVYPSPSFAGVCPDLDSRQNQYDCAR